MIATGICVMGGCFAQNATGAVVDTYWPAAQVDIPQQKGVDIISIPFPGGDSVNDVFFGRGDFQWSNPDNPQYNYCLGVNSYQSPQGGYIGGGGLRNNMNVGQLRFNDGMANIAANEKGWFSFDIRDGYAEAVLGDKKWSAIASAFTLPMEATRSIKLRSWHLLAFSVFCYSNVATGVKWLVQPMRSVGGGLAIWENWTRTLTEL